MMKVKSIDHVNIIVRDIDESIQFYQKYLGFKVLERGHNFINKPFAVIGQSDGFSLCISESDHFSGYQGIAHIAFHVENFDEIEEIVIRENLPQVNDGVIDYDHSRSLYIIDPNGLELELVEVAAGGL